MFEVKKYPFISYSILFLYACNEIVYKSLRFPAPKKTQSKTPYIKPSASTKSEGSSLSSIVLYLYFSDLFSISDNAESFLPINSIILFLDVKRCFMNNLPKILVNYNSTSILYQGFGVFIFLIVSVSRSCDVLIPYSKMDADS